MAELAKIEVSVLVKAGLQRAWDVFTGEAYIVQWNHASPDWRCPRAVNPLQAGATFSWRMESTDGKMGFDFEGTYTEVVPGKKLAYALGDRRTVSVAFEEVPGGIKVTEVFDPESVNPPEMQKAGWQAILDNYRTVAESGA